MAFITLIKDGKQTDITKQLHDEIDGLKQLAKNTKFIHIARKDKKFKDLEKSLDFMMQNARDIYVLHEEKTGILTKLEKAKKGHPVIDRLLDKDVELEKEIEKAKDKLEDGKEALLSRSKGEKDEAYNERFDAFVEPVYKELLEMMLAEDGFKVLDKITLDYPEITFSSIVVAVTIAKNKKESEKGN